MRTRPTAALLGAALLISACSAPDSPPAQLGTEDQKASYGIGMDMGRNLLPAKGHLDMAAFRKGLEDALAEREPAVPQTEIQAALQAFSQTIMEEQQAERTASAETNRAAGEAFLAENAAKEGVTVTESGLQYEVLEPSDGPRPTPSDNVRINYRGTLVDGTEFDSSYERGEPAVFNVGQVIPGFTEALQLMPVGSKYRVVIPSDLAYGPQGAGADIGPNATLIFEIELLEITQ